MTTEAALVHDGELHLPSRSTPIQIGSTEWLEWLKGAKKFRFSHSQGYEVQPGSGIISFRDLTFTAFRAGKDKPYWNAQRRKGGDLRTRYLGRDEDLTYETMVEVALLLDKGSTKDEGKRRSPKSHSQESHSQEHYATEQKGCSQAADEIAKLKAEVAKLTQELQLSEEISNRNFQERNEMWERYQEAHLKNQQIQADLEARGQQLSLKSQECSELLVKLESAQPTVLNLVSEYETNYETIKPTLPKPPKELTRNWVEFWRFKAWLQSR